MHPPLKIIDQTDELIAIEWLREHGHTEYADHMECKPEGTAVFDCIPYSITMCMYHESEVRSRSLTCTRSWSASRDFTFRCASSSGNKSGTNVVSRTDSSIAMCPVSFVSSRNGSEVSCSTNTSRRG